MKKLLSIFTFIFIAATTFAQVNEATITVLGTGVDEEQATLQALRSAIEQTFGVFVSANTTILNDSLIQDEIVSVSTGNVKEYKKIAVATMPNGHVSVSLTATVSINKLIAFAESKGAKAEFAGSVYAANIKLLRLKVESIQMTLELLVQQLEQIAVNMFDFLFEMSEPQRCQDEALGDIYYFSCKIGIVSNLESTNFSNLYSNTIEELKLSEDEIKLCEQNNIELWNWDEYKIYKNVSPRLMLPLSQEISEQYDNRINGAVLKACHRYAIQEIDNPSNHYSYRKWDKHTYSIDSCVCLGDYGTEFDYWPYIYTLCSRKWQKELKIHTFKRFIREEANRDASKLVFSKDGYWWTPGLMTKPFVDQLTLETNETISKSNLVAIHEVRVAIPTSDIEQFQGFELVGGSAPTHSLSGISQAYWDWFIAGKNELLFYYVKPKTAKTTINPSSSTSYRSYGTYPRRYGF